MNTNTGEVYELGAETAELVRNDDTSAMFMALQDRFDLEESERAALVARLRGDPVVPVSGEVAQQLKLGARERERRRARNKRARAARRSNRR